MSEQGLTGIAALEAEMRDRLAAKDATIAEQAQRIETLEAAVAGKVRPIEPSKEAVEWAEGVFAEEDAKDVRIAELEAENMKLLLADVHRTNVDLPRIAELESALGEAGDVLEPFARIEPSVVGESPMPHYWVVIGSPDKSSFTIDNLRDAKAIREKIRDLCHEQSGRAETKGSAQALPNDQSGDGEAR